MSDVVLDSDQQVTVLCQNLNVQGHDFLLDSAERRKPPLAPPRFRRALVHDQNDGLTVNFAGDYPGGLSLEGVAEVRPLRPAGLFPTFIPSLPNLVVRGGISYEVQGISLDGSDAPVTRVLTEELSKLQSQISDLVAQVKALQAPQ